MTSLSNVLGYKFHVYVAELDLLFSWFTACIKTDKNIYYTLYIIYGVKDKKNTCGKAKWE